MLKPSTHNADVDIIVRTTFVDYPSLRLMKEPCSKINDDHYLSQDDCLCYDIFIFDLLVE